MNKFKMAIIVSTLFASSLATTNAMPQTASGSGAIAIAIATQYSASGVASASIGIGSEASGNYSIAFGTARPQQVKDRQRSQQVQSQKRYGLPP